MKNIGKSQQEWASLKYLILSKSQQDYRAISRLFAANEWDAEKEQKFQHYLQHALVEPTKKGELLNAYQHIWGYFKKQATVTERTYYEELVQHFSIDHDELLVFLRELAVKYQIAYLLNSQLLFQKNEKN